VFADASKGQSMVWLTSFDMRWNDRATHAPVVRQLHRHTGNRPSCHPIFPAVTMSCHRTRCKRLRVCKFDQYLESTGLPRRWSVWVHREKKIGGRDGCTHLI
jgi:hypothetical protein